MNDGNDIVFQIDEDDEVFEKYLKNPQPCFVLREDLSPRQLFWLSQTYCIVDFEHEGKRRFGILTKIYKHDFDRLFNKRSLEETLAWFRGEYTETPEKE